MNTSETRHATGNTLARLSWSPDDSGIGKRLYLAQDESRRFSMLGVGFALACLAGVAALGLLTSAPARSVLVSTLFFGILLLITAKAYVNTGPCTIESVGGRLVFSLWGDDWRRRLTKGLELELDEITHFSVTHTRRISVVIAHKKDGSAVRVISTTRPLSQAIKALLDQELAAASSASPRHDSMPSARPSEQELVVHANAWKKRLVALPLSVASLGCFIALHATTLFAETLLEGTDGLFFLLSAFLLSKWGLPGLWHHLVRYDRHDDRLDVYRVPLLGDRALLYSGSSRGVRLVRDGIVALQLPDLRVIKLSAGLEGHPIEAIEAMLERADAEVLAPAPRRSNHTPHPNHERIKTFKALMAKPWRARMKHPAHTQQQLDLIAARPQGAMHIVGELHTRYRAGFPPMKLRRACMIHDAAPHTLIADYTSPPQRTYRTRFADGFFLQSGTRPTKRARSYDAGDDTFFYAQVPQGDAGLSAHLAMVHNFESEHGRAVPIRTPDQITGLVMLSIEHERLKDVCMHLGVVFFTNMMFLGAAAYIVSVFLGIKS